MGEALRQELNDTGVRVTLIEPGMVDTPFFDNPGEIERWRPTTSPRRSCSRSPGRRTWTSTRS